MAITKSDLNEPLDAVRASGDIDVVQRGVELMFQAPIDATATAQIGAEWCPHSGGGSSAANSERHRPPMGCNWLVVVGCGWLACCGWAIDTSRLT